MQPQSEKDYMNLLSEVIKKQIIILGPGITLTKARNVPGLTVADDGTVTAIQGSPQDLTQKLIEQFMELSGMIVKKTMEPLLGTALQTEPVTQTPTPPQAPATPTQPPSVQPIPQAPVQVQNPQPTPPPATPNAAGKIPVANNPTPYGTIIK